MFSIPGASRRPAKGSVRFGIGFRGCKSAAAAAGQGLPQGETYVPQEIQGTASEYLRRHEALRRRARRLLRGVLSERFALDPPHSPPVGRPRNFALAHSVINGWPGAPARRRAAAYARRAVRQAVGPRPAGKRRGPPASAAARPLPMLGRRRPHHSPSARGPARKRRPARKRNNPSHIRQQQRDRYDSDYMTRR